MAQQDGRDRSILKFAQVNCSIDEGFWHRLSSLKLNKLGIDDSPIPITGFYAPCSHSQVSNLLTLLAESLPTDENNQSSEHAIARGNRNRCSVPGTLYNTNTLEAYNALDKKSLLKEEAKKIWDDIHSGRALEDSAVLSRFLIISFADLKKWSFHYRFAFPALVHAPPVTLGELKPASQWFTLEEAASVSAACNDWRNSSSTADVPFFLVCIDSNSIATIRHIRDWETCKADGQKVLFGFYDPCHLPYTPGWPLRNFLSLIYWKWRLKSVHFLSYKENRGFADLRFSIVGEALITDPQEWRDHHFAPNAVGWELNANGKPTARCISLAKSMDPTRLAISAADLNLKLMRWRALPSLNLDKLSSIKCLILGAGALGCQVARMLMAWGVRKITLVDNGKVAMSNPLRQSLYTFDDSLNGGEFKAVAAVKSLQRMFPAVEAEGVVMAVPMLGHPVTRQEEERVIADCRRLHDLVESHGAVFLLTDTREGRWLPSLLCSNSNKITITTALGFDSFLVMRHGSGPFSSAHDLQADSANALSAHVNSLALRRGQRLGCYFCSDMVAPTDSTADHMLDRQCPVSRPGLAHIASSIAVELFINILHHPNGIFAEGEISNSSNTGDSKQPLGILPHQIRGTLNQFSQMTLVDHASNSCTACCSSVVSEYQRRGMEFLLEAINYPTYLEDISGFTELMKSAKSFQLDQDNKVDDNDDDSEEWRKLDQKDHGFEPNAVGWELNTDGKPISRCNSPAKPIDPTRLPISAADLKLKQLPYFNLDKVASMRCLLLGAGTLGCQVARVLMAWGVRKITLLDNGKVAMSNPLRQSLYMFDDCLGGGEFKAVAAVKSLQRIYPAVEAEGVVMAIPMPGHPVTSQEEERVIADCRRMHDLVESHDAVFLLTDTRESRWLPSLLCSSANKITITAALGFDSFLVMRHGSGPLSSDHDLHADSANALSAHIKSLALTDGGGQRLGCYFCNDVVAPTDSTSNRTLDQQCTVTRPALAPIASSLAVELFVNILHHPNGIFAEGQISNTNNSSENEQPLGILPHQIRGTLHQFSQMTLVGLASNSCTACCGTVVSEYRRRGMEFLLQAINHPTYLEDITGLTELMKSANSFQMDWDSIEDEDDDSEL